MWTEYHADLLSSKADGDNRVGVSFFILSAARVRLFAWENHQPYIMRGARTLIRLQNARVYVNTCMIPRVRTRTGFRTVQWVESGRLKESGVADDDGPNNKLCVRVQGSVCERA